MINISIILIPTTLTTLLWIGQLIIVGCALRRIVDSGHNLLTWQRALVLICVLAGIECVSWRHVRGIWIIIWRNHVILHQVIYYWIVHQIVFQMLLVGNKYVGVGLQIISNLLFGIFIWMHVVPHDFVYLAELWLWRLCVHH